MIGVLKVTVAVVCLVGAWLVAKVSAESTGSIVARAGAVIATFHAEGAQIYQCRPESEKYPSEPRALSWQFREPVATLIADGKSIGLHSAGPSWDHIDGSGVKARVVSATPGETANDIAWLRLDAIEHRGSGVLSEAATVERINTKGGMTQGPCETAGAYLSVPYSADYVFLRNNS
ncbi:DUF3455 domain-containing protein [Bradyrhizobium sp. RDM4]|uniref:DUF3455 domain-containing protein n=1 Tax=Bradyrhizobium sp. RDM4 TaxID=3378765 RepID=UPI0038FD1DF3